ncbi:hypothetical protein CI610_00415 [invertebrate metagenome]|uniref:Uncharacterized protein n=1 Tax=invertebrate metagenome TaxID=1711999 RepID=A0A2H9TBM0_9ZZZZ
MGKIPAEKASETDNVINIFTGKSVAEHKTNTVIRLAPECDTMEILYSNDANPNKLFSMKILCWALMENGEIDAMVPWLDKLVSARQISDPLNGHWEGYYDNHNKRVFFDAPMHKAMELKAALKQYPIEETENQSVYQEIPDPIGTHAVLTENNFKTLVLVNVTSWRLYNNGSLQAMVADEKKIDKTPILPGDPCLYPVQEHKDFHYFFHHVIANKIKQGDPDALAAFSDMLDP